MRLHYRLSRLILPVALVSCALAGPAHAALIAYEGFGYAPGAVLEGQNGGVGWLAGGIWSAGANPQAFITVPGLTFGGLGATPGAATATAKPNQPDPAPSDITFEQRDLAATFGDDNTTLYLSFLLRPETGFGFYGGLNLGALFIGKSGKDASKNIVPFYSLETGGANIFSSAVTAQQDETVLLVLRANFLPGNDVLDLFVNPVPGAADPLVADATMTNIDLGTNIKTVAVNNAGAWTIDEIRIGTTFADVTPTAVPAPPVALLVAAGLVLAGLSRRRGRTD